MCGRAILVVLRMAREQLLAQLQQLREEVLQWHSAERESIGAANDNNDNDEHNKDNSHNEEVDTSVTTMTNNNLTIITTNNSIDPSATASATTTTASRKLGEQAALVTTHAQLLLAQHQQLERRLQRLQATLHCQLQYTRALRPSIAAQEQKLERCVRKRHEP